MIEPRYLLDTDICIYIAKHRPREVRRRFEQTAPGELAVSVITFGELRHGAEKVRRADARQGDPPHGKSFGGTTFGVPPYEI